MNGFTLTWKRTAGNSITPIGRGVYFVPVKGASLESRAAMLSRLLPDEVVVARRTAAWLWGLDVLPPGVREADWPVDLVDLVDPSDPQARVPAEHTVEREHVRLTSPARTALDCARWLPRCEAVAGLDQFLRRGVEVAELRQMARTLHGYRDNTRLGEILRLGDRGSASPGESWTKVVVDAGFPRPACQVPVMGPNDRMLYVDLGYVEYRVGLEYDGERHHTGSDARERDRRRRKWLAEEMNWELIPVTRDFLSRPAPYLEALLTALLHRGWSPDDATLERIGRRLRALSRPRR